MFSEKDYFEINREERHLALLLAASIIYEKDFRNSFFNKVNKKIGIDLHDDMFDLYFEVALFRDYWHECTEHEKFIRHLLRTFKINVSNVDHPVFWSKAKGYGRVCFPGQWQDGRIEQHSEKKTLYKIKWLFNAKPDLFIVSKDYGVFIELKLESPFGDYDKYSQVDTLYDIANNITKLVPCLNGKTIKQMIIMPEIKYRRVKKKKYQIEDITIHWEELIPEFDKIKNDNGMIRRHSHPMIKRYVSLY